MGLALPLSSVQKSPQMTSNDAFGVICGDFGLPAQIYICALLALRGISGSGGQKTLLIENYAILHKRNILMQRLTSLETQQVLFFVITTRRG